MKFGVFAPVTADSTTFSPQNNMKCDICIRKEMYAMSRFRLARPCSQIGERLTEKLMALFHAR